MPNIRGIRREIIQSRIDVQDSRILEIGALDYPTYALPDHDVKFVDFASTDDLANKGKRNPRYQSNGLVEVDFVCPNLSYSEEIQQQFDLVIANHVIEHVPDVIYWLEELHSILAPGGHLFLSIPDKRYTFDVARRNSTFIDMLRNYEESVRKPDFYQILDHFYYHKAVTAVEVWEGKHQDKLKRMRYSTKQAVEVAENHARQSYADVHCHVFTCDTFVEVLTPLTELGKIKFELIMIDETVPMTNEFHVLLKKEGNDVKTSK